MENVGTIYAYLEYSRAMWYILGQFDNLVGIFFPVLVYCIKKNLATIE
jgi:hypothetical protein